MSKGVKRVLGIVAAIVVPFAAPAIAGAIGLSGAIGAFGGSALVGAGLGAASSAITGGDPLLGALSGGIGGAVAGLNVPAGAGAAATGTGASGTATSASLANATGAGASAIGAPVVTGSAASGGIASSLGSGTLAAVNSAAPSFAQAVMNIPGQLIQAVGGPQVAMDMAVKLGTALISGAATDDLYAGMPAEQVAAFKQMEADLQEQYAMNKETFQQQLKAATGIIQQGTQMDPEQIAREEATRTKIRDAQASRAGLREIPASMVGAADVKARQDALTSSKNVATSYMGGYTQGQQRKTGLLEAGYRMLPTAPTPTSGEMYRQYAGLNADAADRGKSVGDTIGSIYDTYRRGGDYYDDDAAAARRKRVGNGSGDGTGSYPTSTVSSTPYRI